MKLRSFLKNGAGGGVKAAVMDGGAELTAEQLAKINRFALSPLKAEDVYARKYLIAHNLVDRDRERFSEAILDDFVTTLPGKSYLFGHDRGQFFPLGLLFDAAAEEMSAKQFTEITGEPARLPSGKEAVKVVWAWFYIPRTATSADMIKNIEAGVYRHGSIGFGAADLEHVKGEYGETLFWEYKSPGEAREASLVWLGAQQGATTQKAAGESAEEPHHHKGENLMKTLKILLGKLLGKTFDDTATEEQLASAVEVVIQEKDAKLKEQGEKITAQDTKIKTLETEAAKHEEIKALAEVGKKYRQGLTAEYVRMKTCLGECDTTPEAGAKLTGFADKLPLDFIEAEAASLEKRMRVKFPSEYQLKGDMRRDKSADGKGGGNADNELIPPTDDK